MDSTYPGDVLLVIVLLPRVHIVEDAGEARGPATTELRLDTKDGDSILAGLELLAQRGLDVGPLDVCEFRVDAVNSLDEERKTISGQFRHHEATYHLLSAEKGVHDDLSNVKSKLSVCHFYLY